MKPIFTEPSEFAQAAGSRLITPSIKSVNGKRLLFLIAVAFWLLMGHLLVSRGWTNTWRLWNIPTIMPSFTDARAFTAGAESFAPQKWHKLRCDLGFERVQGPRERVRESRDLLAHTFMFGRKHTYT